MEGMVANNIGDYERTNLRYFGDSSCIWKSWLEWIGCISVIV
jgi:hypothetical protein